MVNKYSREEIYKKHGIYAIKNTVNDRIYIGSSSNLYKRLNAHKNDLLNSKHINSALNNFCKAHGADKFFVEIVEFCEIKDLIIRENFYIKELKGYGHGFNCSPIAESPCRGKVASTETKLKLSVARKNYILKNPEENKNRLNNGRAILCEMTRNGLIKPHNIGKKASDETKRLQRIAKLGKPSKMSEEQQLHRIKCLKEKTSGSKSVKAKLTEDMVLEIRSLIKGGSIMKKEIAKKYNVSHPTICDIEKRRSWNHI